MQVELRQLQEQLGITTIVVTHDQREAMTMADLVVVMSEGRIRQAAPPVEIYRHPADSFVADFIGSTNLLELTRHNGQAAFAGQPLPGLSLPEGQQTARLSIRPEDVHLTAPGRGALTGRVTFLRDLGGTIETFVEVAGTTLTVVSSPRERPQVTAGDEVGLDLPPESCVVLKR